MRICVEMDVSKLLRHHFWLGPLGLESSHYQEVVYESMPTFYGWSCRKQGHLESKCGFKEKSMEKGKVKIVQEDGGKGILKQVLMVVGTKKSSRCRE